MAVCYNFPLSGDVDADKQNVETLINWHFQDLPDNYEIARHEYVYSLQGNRNPFIDSVDFACYINVDNNSYNADGCTNSLAENLDAKLVVFPVPSSEKIYIQVNGTVINSYVVTDMNGRELERRSDLNEAVLILNASDYAQGAYMIQVSTPYGSVNKKMMVE
jgi:hypothetical protein